MSTAILVAGLGYGDEGKGTITDYLCAKRNARLVVRYNGGAQAAHNVVTPDGKHHTFSQVGSGFFQGARTFLSKNMLVDPLALQAELKALAKFGLFSEPPVYVDPQAVVITPYHRAANRIWETIRGDKRHGSCGVGVGEAKKDFLDGLCLRAGELVDPQALDTLRDIQTKKIIELPQDWHEFASEEDKKLLLTTATTIKDWYYGAARSFELATDQFLHDELRKGNVVFEGAQGVLLDEDYGFHPYTTWSKTTFEYADILLKEAGFNGLTERVGVTRSFMTRHGAGPFVSEYKSEDFRFSHFELPKTEHNVEGPWQGKLRFGPLDAVATKYAIGVCGGIDYLAVTHMDHVFHYACLEYNGDLGPFLYGPRDLSIVRRPLEEMEKLTNLLLKCEPIWQKMNVYDFAQLVGARVGITSYGPTCRDKK